MLDQAVAREPLSLDGPIGVLGGGSIAAGILQVLAEAGFQVLVFSEQPTAAAEAIAAAVEMLDRKISKGRIAADAGAAAKAAFGLVPMLGDFRDCPIVIESTLSSIANTQRWIAELENVLGADAVIAVNTSSVPVSVIAEKSGMPERVAGLHFFDPVPLMRIVELIPGLRTAPEVLDILDALVRRTGHRAVRVADSPGFLVNHAGRGLYTEGARIVAERIAEPHVVDRVLRDGVGFRMGPFELLDLIGLDVSLPVMEQIYAQFYQEPRFRPAPFLTLRQASGFLGRRTGEGFYRHPRGEQASEPVPFPDFIVPAVWIDPCDLAVAARIRDHLSAASLEFDDGKVPAPGSLCLVMPVGADATTTAVEKGFDPRRTVAVDAMFGPAPRATLMAAPTVDGKMRAAAIVAFSRVGATTWIEDSPGFIAQRTVAMIVNLACDIAQQGIARPQDIDVAITLGLGYPKGPLALGDEMGARTVLAILNALFDFYGDARYRPSPWLKRRALLGASLATTAT